MGTIKAILIKSIVKPYYRRNAGLFVFLFFIMVLAVGRANEAGLLEYHAALIRGMMINPPVYFLVLLVWLLYCRKCVQFVELTFQNPEFSYLNLLSQLDFVRVFGLLFLVQLMLFLPVSIYGVIVVGVGFHNHWYLQTTIVILYILTICLASAGWYFYLLKNPGKTNNLFRWRLATPFLNKYYWSFLIRYVLTKRKVLFLGIKLYSCATLYFMILNKSRVASDLGMVMLFFCFGMLLHGMLVYLFRELEETRLAFYRGLPVSLFKRFMEYALMYFIVFIPETIILLTLTPSFLSFSEAFSFLFFGYGILLFLNSLLFIKHFRKVEYLKIIVIYFFVVFIGVLTGMVGLLIASTFIYSIYIFFRRYYLFEQSA
jgi:hypothetical protein